MAYTTIDNPELYFQTKTYSGSSGDQAITLDGSENMQPDLCWIKDRGNIENHTLWDAVRGVNKYITSDGDYTEDGSTTGLSAFSTDGFTVANWNGTGASGRNYVAWCWKAGTTAGISGGSITPSGVSINTTAGFGIYKWSGTGSAGTIAHGLGKTPQLIQLKRLDTTYSYLGYVHSLGSSKNLALNLSNAPGNAGVGIWNLTNATSTVFSVGTDDGVNLSGGTYVAYVWSNVQGYQKIGTYEGAGATTDNTYVHLGFKPAMIIVKAIDTANQWNIFDNKRNTENPMDKRVWADSNDAETTYASFDFLAQGFKVRNTSVGIGTADTFIYYAVAEAPFVNSNGVPCNAR